MSEMSDLHKLIMAMKLAKTEHVGMALMYFDVIELLGELDSLKSYIAELEAERRWIPVSERLPENSGSYLGLVSYGIEPYAEEVVYYRESKVWVLDEKQFITHWMPLPYSARGEQ